MRASGVGEIVVVVGAHDVETSERTAFCPDWRFGPGASLRCGLRSLGEDVEAAAVVLADGPELSPRAIDRVVDAWRSGDALVVAASYGGVRGHPVVLARAVWDAVPDEGARSLGAVLVPCDDLGSPGDVDFADDVPSRLRRGAGEL